MTKREKVGSWIAVNAFWILFVCGALTCSMISLALVPRAIVRLVFGEEISGAATLLMARSWGAMIFMSGALLIASAYHPEFRTPILINAIAGKLGFAVLVFANGRRFLARPALPMALIDLAMVALFAGILAAPN